MATNSGQDCTVFQCSKWLSTKPPAHSILWTIAWQFGNQLCEFKMDIYLLKLALNHFLFIWLQKKKRPHVLFRVCSMLTTTFYFSSKNKENT